MKPREKILFSFVFGLVIVGTVCLVSSLFETFISELPRAPRVMLIIFAIGLVGGAVASTYVDE